MPRRLGGPKRMRADAILLLSLVSMHLICGVAAAPTKGRRYLRSRRRTRSLRTELSESPTPSRRAYATAFNYLSPSGYGHPSYVAAFKRIEGWPVPNSALEDISSNFGPRLRKAPDDDCPDDAPGCYDFNSGVDIEADLGDPVVAVQSGKVVRVTSYTCGGLTVEIMHQFESPVTFHPDEEPVTRYFTRYGHLESASVTVGQDIVAGEVIAEVGDDGLCTDVPMLHFELILGTSEYVIPEADDNPRVHPHLVLPHLTMWTPILTQVSDVGTNSRGAVKIETMKIQANINRYEVQITNQDGTEVKARQVLDLDLHEGFGSLALGAYIPDATAPHIVPHEFGVTTFEYTAELIIPGSWIPSPYTGTDTFKVMAIDVRGHRYEITGPIIS